MKRIILALLLLIMGNCILAQVVTKNPTKAVGYSIFPGGGQLYNEAYLKAGIVIGMQTFWVASAIHNNSQVQDYKDKIATTTDEILQQSYADKLKQYKEKRTRDFWWMGITLAFSTLDAYIDAHLSNFKAEKDKIHLRFEEQTLFLEYNF
ncbi:MAG: hypothetical protein KA963_04010 [Candidatus Cloacimonas sp.]|nr:hypothetical protein [Candidatus Cloacimonas sp.]HPB18434.1 DUF5683 domain-containing protein [Candidatus Cloacimonas sp.]HQO17876.1 DUF5683 domain-containing protein [Candidatus Cloacimonas sp.]